MSRLLLFLLLAGLAVTAQAQTVTSGPDSTAINRPLPAKKQLSAADSAARTERLFGFHVTRPNKAALLSLAPGGGQIYNKRWWKVPVVYGLLGSLGAVEYFYQVRFREYKRAYNMLKAKEATIGDSKLGPHASRELSTTGINSSLEFYRGNRDLYFFYLTAGYGLQILDALVDAHLHDFDVSDDLAFHWTPSLLPVPGQSLPGLGIAATLKLKK